MKITIYIGSLGVGGAERVACNLANYMVVHGNKVEIVTMSDLEAAYPLHEEVVLVPLIRKAERKNFACDNLLRLRRLRQYFKKTDSDCCLSMSTDGLSVLYLLRGAIKIPVAVTERANPDNYSRWKQWLHRKTAGFASGFVFQTEDALDWYKKHIEGIPAKIIPNAANFTEEVAPDCGERKKQIVTAARFSEVKNLPLLLRGFAKIADVWKDYQLVIYGDGPLRDQLEQEAQRLGISKRVCMPGFTNSVAEAIKDAALYVLSSDNEGMPNALIEAMSLGLPCISTDCGGGGARFLIQSGENGLLVPVNDVEKMAEAMDYMLRNPEEAERMGEYARKITDRLAPEKIYGEWEQFLEEVSQC